jgi:hypothetical protein
MLPLSRLARKTKATTDRIPSTEVIPPLNAYALLRTLVEMWHYSCNDCPLNSLEALMSEWFELN